MSMTALSGGIGCLRWMGNLKMLARRGATGKGRPASARKEALDLHRDPRRVHDECAGPNDAGLDAPVALALVVDHGTGLIPDDKIMPNGRKAKVVAELGAGIDRLTGRGDDLDHDHGIADLDGIPVERFAAADAGVRLIDRVFVDPYRQTVRVGPARYAGGLNGFTQGDVYVALAFRVAHALGQHGDDLSPDEFGALRLVHRPRDELVGGHPEFRDGGHHPSPNLPTIVPTKSRTGEPPQ